MRYMLLALVMAACGSDESDIHDVGTCNNGGACERACIGPASQDLDNSCNATDVNGVEIICTAPLRIVDGISGCCYTDDGVSRFAECE